MQTAATATFQRLDSPHRRYCSYTLCARAVLVVSARPSAGVMELHQSTSTNGPKPHKSGTITVEENGMQKQYTTITEGKATILFPGGGEVFYNPIQNFNRDLSVLAIKTFGEVYLKEREERRAKRRKGQWKGKPKADLKVEGGEEKVDDMQTWDEGTSTVKNGGYDGGDGGEGGQQVDKSEHPGGDTMVIDKSEQEQVVSEGGGDQQQPRPRSPQPFRILDALSATGLRALRYANEIPFTTALTANDISPAALASIHRNLAHNQSSNPCTIAKITATLGSATTHMYLNPQHYQVVDLDPYGTAAPFFDAALQSIITKDSGPGGAGPGGSGGGMLCVTCTDAGVWASTGYSEKCFALYGGMPMKGDASHEAGLRLILYSIATTAAKYGLAIEPLLSLSIDFYARVFVRIKKSPAEVKNLASKSMLVHNCDSGCGAWRVVPLGRAKKEMGRSGEYVKYGLAQVPDGGVCEHCGYREHIAGPMWAGELHSPEFCRDLLETIEGADMEVYSTSQRIRGMVSTALNECTFTKLPISIAEPPLPPSQESIPTTHSAEPQTLPYPPLPAPYFFHLPTRLSKTIHSVSPTQAALRGALLSLGYPVGRSHCRPNSIKTTAPWVVVWEIMRQWVERGAAVKVKEQSFGVGAPGGRILWGYEWEGQGHDRKARGNKSMKSEGDSGKEVKGEQRHREEKEISVDTQTKSFSAYTHIRACVGLVDFNEALGRDEERVRGREVRYQMNPTAYWGPMKAAKGLPSIGLGKPPLPPLTRPGNGLEASLLGSSAAAAVPRAGVKRKDEEGDLGVKTGVELQEEERYPALGALENCAMQLHDHHLSGVEGCAGGVEDPPGKQQQHGGGKKIK